VTRGVPGAVARAPGTAATSLTVAGPIVCAGAVAVAATGAPTGQALGRGLLELLAIGVPMAAGIYALRAPATARFGVALVVCSLAWSLTALAEASGSVPYTVGRLATWLVPPCIYYLLLVFPEGRLTARFERALCAAIVALAVLLFFGSAFFVAAYPAHTPWATCDADCPANALFVLDREPAVMGDVVVPLREWLLCAVLVGLVVSMIRRRRAASPLRRRTMGPVVAAGSALAVCQIAFYATRGAGAPAAVVETLGAVWGLCLVAVAGAFLFALFRRRLQLAEVLTRLGGAVRREADPARLRDGLAAALGDPTLELVVLDEASQRRRDSAGREVAWPPQPSPGRAVTAVAADGPGPPVALIHDIALRDDEELLRAVSTLVLGRWRHEQAAAGLGRATAELAELRVRITETADLERARIERDLHDGAQQRLIALRIRLALAEETLHEDPAAGAEAVRALGIEAERALEDLRAYAMGVFPATLREQGLDGALQALARDAPIPVHVTAAGVTRHPLEIESAVYFATVEAIQNAMKHAPTTTGVWVDLTEDDALRFEVRDDGPGFTLDGAAKRGLRNMRDRIEAIGGRLSIHTAPGRGTRVSGVVWPARETPEWPADRRGGESPIPELPLYERLLPAVASSVTRVRAELNDALTQWGVAPERLSDVALLITEAATNVVVHAYSAIAPGPLYATAVLRGHTLVVSVVDCGSGTLARPGRPGAGLGFSLMTGLADDLRIRSDLIEGGTAVQAAFDHVIGAAPAEPAAAPEEAPASADVLQEYVRLLAATHVGDVDGDSAAVVAQARQTLARVRRDQRARRP